MKNKDNSLRKKIFIGYFVVVIVISSMITIVLYERSRVQYLEYTVNKIDFVHENINKIHSYIAKLAIQGEFATSWDNSDVEKYHENCLLVDSILQGIKNTCMEFSKLNQIDSLRLLLRDKETHLLRIMKVMREYELSDSLLISELFLCNSHLPKTKYFIRKKDSLSNIGIYQFLCLPDELRYLNKKLFYIYAHKAKERKIYADSLRSHNKELNIKLYKTTYSLDKQLYSMLKGRNKELADEQECLYYLSTSVIVIVIFLLLFSFIIIRSDFKKEECIKLKLQQTVNENESLLKMRNQIILTVSHDIRGPIGNINNCAELISKTREKKKRDGYIENIRYSCHHILHLVNDLMDAYRLNESKEIKNIPFQLDKFLSRISDDFSRKANIKALIFKSTQKDTTVIVKGDPDKIEQILSNLLSNTIKFTPSGSICFLSKYEEGVLQMEVCDTGIGMDENTMRRMYTPFERAAQSINSEGFGLGLFITKGLVNVLKGSINVKSTLNKGTTFSLSIPLIKTDEKVEDLSSETSFSILPVKVLVVDDDSILLKVTKDMLECNGIMCTTCLNVKDAVATLYESSYDLVLTDIQMPVIDGFGLLELFRNSDIGNSRVIPIAAMTAQIDDKLEIYEQFGFCGCLHKPFEMKELLSFLSSILLKNGYSEFDFSRLLENADDRCDMFVLIIKESEKDLEELRQALNPIDRKAMRETIHRMIPVWEMLGKREILHEFQIILHDVDASEQYIEESCRKVIDWIQKLIVESKERADRYENINS